MAKPTFVCVPGAWHSPEAYSGVMDRLKDHGYPTIGLPLPSIGAVPTIPNFVGDVNAVRDRLTQLVVEKKKEVILVMHSYGGMPGTEAPVGLGKQEREEKGLEGGVIRLVYIMALAAAEGYQRPQDGGFEDWITVDLENAMLSVTPENAKRIFYHDLPSDEADKWAAKLTHQSLGVFTSTTTYAAWRYIPSTFVIGTEDRTPVNVDFVKASIKAAQEIQPTAFDVVETCDAGHCLMLSRPEWLTGVLRRAAGEQC